MANCIPQVPHGCHLDDWKSLPLLLYLGSFADYRGLYYLDYLYQVGLVLNCPM